MARIVTTGATPEIVTDPSVLAGEPRVAGTRVSVQAVVVLAQSYRDLEQVYRALPTLPPGGVEVALAYYDDHREEIDRLIAETEAEAYQPEPEPGE